MFRFNVFFALVELFSLAGKGSAARVLALYPFPSISHQFVVKSIFIGLANRGHEIVYCSTLPRNNIHPNVTYREINGVTPFDLDDGDPLISKTWPILQTIYSYEYQLVFTREYLESTAIQNLIHSNESFDIVMHEPFLSAEFTAAFVHKFNALSVVVIPGTHSSWLTENAGLVDNPSYMVDFRGFTSDKMNFCERAINTVNLWVTTVLSYYYVQKMQAIVMEYMNYTGWESRPHLKELLVDNALILINTHHSLGSNYPRAPHVKEMGGIHVSSVALLPDKKLSEFLDGASEGFIYFSLGSITSTNHKTVLNFIKNLLKALSSVKLKVLFKLRGEPAFEVPDNVMISQWVPQQDVLGHRHIKLFISHGGYQSTIETVHHGVPMLAVPFFYDQFKNAELVALAGYGKSVDLATATSSSLLASVNEIINNPKYKNEAMRRSNLMKERLLTPLNESIYWIEYVLKHGKVLQPASLRLSFIQLHQLDVQAIVLACVVAFIGAVKHLLRCILLAGSRKLRQVSRTKKTQ